MRYWISKLVQSCTVIVFPFGTMAVNVAGCLIIGFLSGLNWREGGWMSPSAKLLLTTGFCGGFTTFSTFSSDVVRMLKSGDYTAAGLCIALNFAACVCCILLGAALGRLLKR